jgi:transketolase C-terminal domain/subunit
VHRGIRARFIDRCSIKPVDVGTLVAAAEATEGRGVAAEDHHPRAGSARPTRLPCSAREFGSSAWRT